MAVLKATRSAQYPLVMEFVFNYNDTALDSVTGASKTWGSTFGDNITFDAVPMPPGAVITGGEVIVETAWTLSTAATISVGIAGSLTTLANAVDLKTVARTALTLTSPLLCNAGQNIRLTQSVTVANAGAGKARIRVMYTIDGRGNEVQAA